jgi:hypothetical protein
MSNQLSFIRLSREEPLEDHITDKVCLERTCLCEKYGWTPTDTQPLPPGIKEEHSTEELDISMRFGGDEPLPDGCVCHKVDFIYDLRNFMESNYVPVSDADPETPIIDAIHPMAHNVKTNLERGRAEGWNLHATIRMIFEASDGSPRSWMNPAYTDIFRHFLPILFDDEPLDTPLEQRHLDRIETYRLGFRNQPEHDNLPYSESALAHDDGTRQDIVDYSSEDEGFEFGSEEDEEYPMEEPFTAKEIETRDNCSKILQILDGVMEKGGTVTDGNYLEMCNILKELYKQ